MVSIAIVEDGDKEAAALTRCLERYEKENCARFSYVRFSDAMSFLEYREAVDIVFMDIMLPNISGIEAARQLRKFNDTFVPVVFVMLVLGVAGGVGVMLTDVPMLPLVPCAFWSLAFSFFLSNRLMMFGDYLNGLPGLSGGGNIIELVFFILIGTVLCAAAEIAICFMDTPGKRASRA